MSPDIKNLLTIYENKLASFWQLAGEMRWCENDNRLYMMETRQRILDKEVKECRANLVAAISAAENYFA